MNTDKISAVIKSEVGLQFMKKVHDRRLKASVFLTNIQIYFLNYENQKMKFWGLSYLSMF